MTNRSRRDTSAPSAGPSRADGLPGRPRPPAPPPPGPLAGLGSIHVALTPLRAFLGFTFLFAGFDKFATRGFLEATGPGSIGEQLQGFTRDSPLAPLIQAVAIPNPVAIGALIALAEVAIGLGLLTGLLYRAAAVAGALTAAMFWLTASWSTSPYYYGPDLPVLFGFVTLALAGHGGLLVVHDVRAWRAARRTAATEPGPAAPGAVGRREVLQAAVLGLAALAIGASTRLLFGRGSPTTAGSNSGGGTSTPSPSAAPASGSILPAGSASPAPAATEAPRGPLIGNVSQLGSGGAAAFVIPSSGDPGVIVSLGDGRFVAYDAVCTHEGCTVAYDAGSQLLRCPCHGARFDPSSDGEVLRGPARRPLAAVPIVIDQATGQISLGS